MRFVHLGCFVKENEVEASTPNFPQVTLQKDLPPTREASSTNQSLDISEVQKIFIKKHKAYSGSSHMTCLILLILWQAPLFYWPTKSEICHDRSPGPSSALYSYSSLEPKVAKAYKVCLISWFGSFIYTRSAGQ